MLHVPYIQVESAQDHIIYPPAVLTMTTNLISRLLINHGHRRFTIKSSFLTGSDSHPQYASLTDINNDPHLDVVVADVANNNGICIYLAR